MTNQKDLIDKITHGDEDAFAQLMELYAQGVYTLIVRITRCEEDAEELTPDNAIDSMPMVFDKKIGMYWGQVTGIAAKQIDETVYIAATYVYRDDGKTYRSGVLPYSVGKYCKNKANDPELQDLAKATAVYGYYAKTYFSKK